VGKIIAGSREDVARLGMGVAVRAGATKPDIRSTESFKRALAAATIGYTDPVGGGASGIYFAKLLDRLGIADAVKAKTKLTAGPVGELVAKGAAELGVQQLAELKTIPGIDIVGPLPPDLQTITVLTAGVVTGSGQAEAAGGFVKFLAMPETVSVLRAAGMDPG
jgi:molybdate transport system substrate-binding protein